MIRTSRVRKRPYMLVLAVITLSLMGTGLLVDFLVVNQMRQNRERFGRMVEYVRNQCELASSARCDTKSDPDEGLAEILCGIQASVKEVHFESSGFFVYSFLVTMTDGRVIAVDVGKAEAPDQEFRIVGVLLVAPSGEQRGDENTGNEGKLGYKVEIEPVQEAA